MALDHRGTAPMLVRGVDPVLLLKEYMGEPGGLNGGMGGHMHLFSPDHLAATSGIVGASGPAAVGYALANQRLRPGKISVAFFGEGATNEGMMLEAFNLAVIWNLPVMFVCKDNGQAIVTRSQMVSGGDLIERAAGFGLRAVEVDGSDVEEVWMLAREEIKRLRRGLGPVFLLASCVHIEGHFLGDQLLRMAHPSLSEMVKTAIPLLKAHLHPGGAPFSERVAGAKELLEAISAVRDESQSTERDPIAVLQRKLTSLDKEKILLIGKQVHSEMGTILQAVLSTGSQMGGQAA